MGERGTMSVARFEEKEYEIAAAIELGTGEHGLGRVYPSGQVLEKLVGYDVAADPTERHPIWTVLRLPRPQGVQVLPDLWLPAARPEQDRLPAMPVSLILQYKRPEYLHGARAAQWRYWNRPYYRFERSVHQHRVLRRLEAKATNVVVRYAAPAFWRYEDFDYHRHRGRVLENSGFVSPGRLGKHRVWTYERPGQTGRANPNGRWTTSDTLESLLSAVRQLRTGDEFVPYQGLETHLNDLAIAATDSMPAVRRPIANWARSLYEAQLDMDRAEIESVVHYVTVQSVLSRVGAAWYVLAAR